MDRIICASLSHTHYWYEVGMLKVPAFDVRTGTFFGETKTLLGEKTKGATNSSTVAAFCSHAPRLPFLTLYLVRTGTRTGMYWLLKYWFSDDQPAQLHRKS